MKPIHTILVANRGEISCRVQRTAKQMGLRTVAVFSDADRNSLHCKVADHAEYIGPSPAAESYLRIDRVIEAAKRSSADAIHPGYGFLSENAEFARRCDEAGITFIGPSPNAIDIMGNKASAKKAVSKFNVPTVPGYFEDLQDDATLQAEATRVGFPLIIKAVAGGGGRGMRLVHDAGSFIESLQGARREAKAAFGNDAVMLERWLDNSRHIEVQILADRHENVVALGERDCSTQRRRQKVIEEAPASVIDEATRQALLQSAVAAARSVGYVGAGTVEFIVASNGEYFFLEMNTRLQVEHPVTEFVTGIDLVEWQIRVARGERLSFSQSEIRAAGHAIEARLYAEDPAREFAPQTGEILLFDTHRAKGLEGVRIDTGVESGDAVSTFYDPMIAKFIAHGTTRADATARLIHALQTVPLHGLTTNRAFLLRLLRSEEFTENTICTNTLDMWSDERHEVMREPAITDADWALGAAMCIAAPGTWFRTNGDARFSATIQHGDEERKFDFTVARGQNYSVAFGDQRWTTRIIQQAGVVVELEFDGVHKAVERTFIDRGIVIQLGDEPRRFTEPSPYPATESSARATDSVISPIAGSLVKLTAVAGSEVCANEVVAIIEAMKMETRVLAPRDGLVSEVLRNTGDQVRAGEVLVALHPSAE